MLITSPLLDGRLVRRYKRFLADVELADGTTITAHCPNPGSMESCCEIGARVILRDSQDETRKLRTTLQTIEIGGHWVNVDTALPNAVVAEAIAAGEIAELAGYTSARREVKYGTSSRIDLLLEAPDRPRCFVEVKNATLRRGTRALFPDAVTERGKKHLDELVRVVENGERAVMFFFVSRADVEVFAPADEIDPAYGAMLRQAVGAGVEALAYVARVEPASIEIGERLEIDLSFTAVDRDVLAHSLQKRNARRGPARSESR